VVRRVGDKVTGEDGGGDLLRHRGVRRQVIGGPQECRLVGVLDRDLGDDRPPKMTIARSQASWTSFSSDV
jgi:hypothetical protein